MISIVIPCYNAELYILNCINSLKLQTYTNWEAIFINDGSSDSTEKILIATQVVDNRVKYFTQDNRGAAKARELGVSKATGDYVLFLDVDDLLKANALELLVRIAKERFSDIVVSGFNIIKKGKVVRKVISPFDEIDNITYLKRVLCGKNGFELCAKLYKRSLFFVEIDYPEKIRIGEDAIVLVQLVCNAKRINGCQEAVYDYIQYNSSASHQKSLELAEETIKAACLIENYLKNSVINNVITPYIDSMFLLFYSNSTRKFRLEKKHPLMKIVQTHFSISSFMKIPLYKSAYILYSYYLKIK